MGIFKTLFGKKQEADETANWVFVTEKPKESTTGATDAIPSTASAEPVLKYEHNSGFSFLPKRFTDDDGEVWFAKYQKRGVKISRSDSTFNEIFSGDYFDVTAERIDNLFVAKAYFHGQYLGSFESEGFSKMIYDFQNRKEPVRCIVNMVRDEEIAAAVFFYKKKSEHMDPVKPFVVKLAKTGKEEVQEDIACCNVGDKVSVEDIGDGFVVWCDAYEIGYIPESKVEIFEDLERSGYNYDGTILKIEENSNFKLSVWIEVCPD